MFVGGLPYHVRERDIERFFKGFGIIREILLKKGYCFVVSIGLMRRTIAGKTFTFFI